MMATAGLINNDFVRRLEEKLQSAGRSSSYWSFGIRKWVDAMSKLGPDANKTWSFLGSCVRWYTMDDFVKNCPKIAILYWL